MTVWLEVAWKYFSSNLHIYKVKTILQDYVTVHFDNFICKWKDKMYWITLEEIIWKTYLLRIYIQNDFVNVKVISLSQL